MVNMSQQLFLEARQGADIRLTGKVVPFYPNSIFVVPGTSFLHNFFGTFVSW
jgi:hypothetical protein